MINFNICLYIRIFITSSICTYDHLSVCLSVCLSLKFIDSLKLSNDSLVHICNNVMMVYMFTGPICLFSFALIISAPLAGWLSDRFGIRIVMLVGTFFYGGSTIVAAYAPNITVVIIFYGIIQGKTN